MTPGPLRSAAAIILCMGDRHLPCYCCNGKEFHHRDCPVTALGPAPGLCRCESCCDEALDGTR